MKKQIKIQPRNAVAVAAHFRSGAGGHGKTRKAQRRADKISLASGRY